MLVVPSDVLSRLPQLPDSAPARHNPASFPDRRGVKERGAVPQERERRVGRAGTDDLDGLSDEELIEGIRERPEESDALREALFQRAYPRVARFCLRFCGNAEDAGDLAQEVFLKVHARLHTFRGQSRFSTWLYAVSRNTALNWAAQNQRRRQAVLDGEPETFVDPRASTETIAAQAQIGAKLREAMAHDLDPLEAKILYLHHVDGLTLPSITSLLGLENRSGAKAYVVSGTRKLRRKFGRWLRSQTAEGRGERVGNDDLSKA